MHAIDNSGRSVMEIVEECAGSAVVMHLAQVLAPETEVEVAADGAEPAEPLLGTFDSATDLVAGVWELQDLPPEHYGDGWESAWEPELEGGRKSVQSEEGIPDDWEDMASADDDDDDDDQRNTRSGFECAWQALPSLTGSCLDDGAVGTGSSSLWASPELTV